MDVSGEKVLVFGTGLSGIAAAKLLLSEGAEVVLFDGNEELDRSRVLANFEEESRLSLFAGTLPAEAEAGLKRVILSPGVPPELPMIRKFAESGIPVWGEVELAWRAAKGDLLAITGTNGKTTTTALLGEIMKRARADVKIAGNIGIPYTGIVEETTDSTVTVAEISSFQLETIDEFCPQVSAILNITPDHLNRHHTMENYAAAKLNIAKNQTEEMACVLNYEDEILRAHADEIRARIVWFSSLRRLSEGIFLDGDRILFAENGEETFVIRTEELNLLGRHNYENVMAACAMALSYGVPLEKIRETLRSFTAVEHRIEYVTEKRGVHFYNDSKATNPDAAIQAIRAMNRPTCLIGGGYDKDSSFTEWIRAFDGNVKVLVLIGQTREKIAQDARAVGFTDYLFADSLQEAVDLCYAHAENGDAVLLSPACASWGMFPNYEVRGRMFKEMVNALEE